MMSTHEQDIYFLKRTIELSIAAKQSGNHPFGALLLGPNGEVLVVAGNTFAVDKGVGHAEANVARIAASSYEWDYLEKCSLYTSVEPCCMCSGSVYWTGIGTVVFGATERSLGELTGDHPENLTLDLPCDSVFAAGRRKIVVRGPFKELRKAILDVHEGFWS